MPILKDSVYKAVTQMLGNSITCVHSEEGAPMPSYPFVLLTLISDDPVGGEQSTVVVNDASSVTGKGSISYAQDYIAVVRIRFMDKAENDASINSIAKSFEFGLRKQSSQQVMYSNGLGLMSRTPMVPTPRKTDTEWVSCYQIDCTFSYHLSDREVVDWIESVSLPVFKQTK